MLRMRRKFSLILCAVCIILFLVLYLLINYAAPANDSKKRLENGLKQHGQDLQHLKSRLNGVKGQRQLLLELNDNDLKNEVSIVQDNNKTPFQIRSQKRIVEWNCSALDEHAVPQPDIQMLDLYTEMSFADIDGGVWKQGWNIKYDPLQYNDHHKLKVFVVPHSHNDPGWIQTFDDYYQHDTKHILSNALRHLRDNPEMKFIWAEISYFSRFYESLGDNNKQEMKKLIQNGQLEFVTGGWVMPDEANSHWSSVLLQLTEGQTWIKKYFNITPESSWSIDPFGHSPTLPYILKKSGFKNLLIQRTHYSVKKTLALKRQLEFYWRQLWDNGGTTDLFTHMMPFYSYDIPHTCGPDPKICCQFDFKRMNGFGLSCPWRVPPQTIDENNVAERAELLTDQWKKKAELYRTNVLLIPLGDDFRYSKSTEWDLQRINYQALFDHINAERKYFVEAKFGTLQEYFDAVQREQRKDFPTLSGDFFTYADRADNYWSGYYTSRPYHKRMDRVLLHYVRSAEMLYSWGGAWGMNAKFDEMLQNARRELSLFQHHDGITGTAKTHVVVDYANRMLGAVKSCKFVMQQAVYRLLTKPSIYNADYKFIYFNLDDSHWPGPDDSRTTIILGEDLPSTYVVFHNSLSQWREELVNFFVSSPYMSITDFDKNPIQAQVSPVWSWNRHMSSDVVIPQPSNTKYRMSFKVKVPPLGLITYIIHHEPSDVKPPYTSFAKNLILTTNPMSYNLGIYPNEVKFGEHREMSIRVGNGPTVAFSSDGVLKSIQINDESPHIPVHLKFFKYGTRIQGDRSGAYLFLPNGPAMPFMHMQPPVVLVTEGPLESTVSVGFPSMIHQTILQIDTPLEIRNLVDIGEMDDTEISMRLSTHIQSGDVFFTDLNGLQMIKRKHFSKLPIQANFYPVPSAIYIEDDTTRMTLVSAQPLGGTSLASGEIEIMQDRRLKHDDERGLGQGVLDNKPVWHIFRLILEQISECDNTADTHPAGALTLSAYKSSKSILNPINKFIFSEQDWLGAMNKFGSEHEPTPDDVDVVAMRQISASNANIQVVRDRKQTVTLKTGLIVHRTKILRCSSKEHLSGKFNLKETISLGKNISGVHNTTLTFLHLLHKINVGDEISLCPMDTKAFLIEHYS